MVSYKKLYEEMKEKYEHQIASMNKGKETEYKCPLCGAILLENIAEFYCSNENCKFDKTLGDLIYYYASMNNLEEVD